MVDTNLAVSPKTKGLREHLARTRAWVRLRAQGHGLTGIGKASGFDHSTIYCALKRAPNLEEWHATGKRPPKLQHSIDAVLRNEARP